MKKIIKFGLLMMIFLISISVVSALDECGSFTPVDDVPCLVFLPINYSQNCTTKDVDIHFNGTYVLTESLTQFTNFTCSFTFDESSLGPYNFYFSTGDTGSLTITEGNVMIQLFWFSLVLAVGLMGLGLYLHNHPMVALSGIIGLTLGFWVFLNGYSVYNNLITQMLSLVLIGVGGYYLIVSLMALIDEGYDSEEYSD